MKKDLQPSIRCKLIAANCVFAYANFFQGPCKLKLTVSGVREKSSMSEYNGSGE